ncbi:MAG: hypothetical protein RLZZ68_1485 [Bacteroidota bacterium]|jgi:hypothetical protein
MIFPQYRKHTSGKNQYKITGPEHFTEIQCLGSKTFVYEVQAKTYFEKIRIQEMLEAAPPYLASNQAEFDALVNG